MKKAIITTIVVVLAAAASRAAVNDCVLLPDWYLSSCPLVWLTQTNQPPQFSPGDNISVGVQYATTNGWKYQLDSCGNPTNRTAFSGSVAVSVSGTVTHSDGSVQTVSGAGVAALQDVSSYSLIFTVTLTSAEFGGTCNASVPTQVSGDAQCTSGSRCDGGDWSSSLGAGTLSLSSLGIRLKLGAGPNRCQS